MTSFSMTLAAPRKPSRSASHYLFGEWVSQEVRLFLYPEEFNPNRHDIDTGTGPLILSPLSEVRRTAHIF